MSSQQPIDVYPNSVMIKQQPSTSSSNSNNGSFGPVFIVLGVVAFVSVVACVLGRFCSRRRPHHHHRANKESHSHHHHQNQQKPITTNNNKVQQQSHVGGGLGPKEWESRQNPSTLDHHDHVMMRSSSGPRGGDGVDGELGGGGGGFHNKFKFPSSAGGRVGGGIRDNLQPHHHGRTPGHRPEVRFADNINAMHRGV